MEFKIPALLTFWVVLLSQIITVNAIALPAQKLAKRCDNQLQNPSFESGLSPWLTIVQEAWDQRGVYTSPDGGHDGSNFYFAHSNSTISSTLTIAQSGINLSNGESVDCAAWVALLHPGNVGSTQVDVFLDGETCGSANFASTGWTRVGGTVSVNGDGAIHTMAVVFTSNGASEDGWYLWLDDLVVGADC